MKLKFVLSLIISLLCLSALAKNDWPQEVVAQKKAELEVKLASPLEVKTMKDFSDLVVEANELYETGGGMSRIVDSFKSHPSFPQWAHDFKNFYSVVGNAPMSDELLVAIASRFLPIVVENNLDLGMDMAEKLIAERETMVIHNVYDAINEKLQKDPLKLISLIEKVLKDCDTDILKVIGDDLDFMAANYKALLPQIGQVTSKWLEESIERRKKFSIPGVEREMVLSQKELTDIRIEVGDIVHEHFRGEYEIFFSLVKNNAELYANYSGEMLADLIGIISYMPEEQQQIGLTTIYAMLSDGQNKVIFGVLVDELSRIIYDKPLEIKKLKGFLMYKEQEDLIDRFNSCNFALK